MLKLSLGHLLNEVGGVLQVVAVAANGDHNTDLLGRRKLMNSLNGRDEVRVGCYQDCSVVKIFDGVGNHTHGNVYIGSLFFVSPESLMAEVAGDFLLPKFAEYNLDTSPSLGFYESLMLLDIIRLPLRQSTEVNGIGQRIFWSEDRLC